MLDKKHDLSVREVIFKNPREKYYHEHYVTLVWNGFHFMVTYCKHKLYFIHSIGEKQDVFNISHWSK
jgi:hypothetical protein